MWQSGGRRLHPSCEQSPALAYTSLQPPTSAYTRLQPPTSAYTRLQPHAAAYNPLTAAISWSVGSCQPITPVELGSTADLRPTKEMTCRVGARASKEMTSDRVAQPKMVARQREGEVGAMSVRGMGRDATVGARPPLGGHVLQFASEMRCR